MCYTPLPLGHLPLARGGVEKKRLHLIADAAFERMFYVLYPSAPWAPPLSKGRSRGGTYHPKQGGGVEKKKLHLIADAAFKRMFYVLYPSAPWAPPLGKGRSRGGTYHPKQGGGVVGGTPPTARGGVGSII